MKQILLFCLLLPCLACGSTPASDDSLIVDTANSINTEKLIGTPFEGLTTGDDFPFNYFDCGQYATTSIDSFPIQIFAAFFTPNQEEIIQEGIDIANEGAGFTEYALTDTWSDDVRVIYKVNVIADTDEIAEAAAGRTNARNYIFNNHIYSENISADWSIELLATYGINKWTVAHELCHASGLLGHYLIDYVNNSVLDLEENSLMSGDLYFFPSDSPILTDYNFMMHMQGQLMQNYLGETGAPWDTQQCAD